MQHLLVTLAEISSSLVFDAGRRGFLGFAFGANAVALMMYFPLVDSVVARIGRYERSAVSREWDQSASVYNLPIKWVRCQRRAPAPTRI